MKKLISLFAILAMVFSMQSCINSGDTPDATQTIALKGYNHIHEPAKVDAPLRNKAAKYEMDINLSQMTMTLKATGAIESDGEEISLVFNNIALKYDQTNGGFSFSLPEATPVASDGNNYKVTDLNGSIAAYALSNSATSSMVTAITVLQISYTVNDKYDIFATLQTSTSATPEIYYTNCSTTTSAEGIAPFTTTVTTYLVNFITSTKANVTIVSAQFAQRMPQIRLRIQSRRADSENQRHSDAKLQSDKLPHGNILKGRGCKRCVQLQHQRPELFRCCNGQTAAFCQAKL